MIDHSNERALRRRRVLRRSLALATLAALAVSVALNAMLYSYARRYFFESEALRLDPAGLWSYGDKPVAAPGSRPRLVLFGDSRAEMWEPSTLPRGIEVVNRGIGAQTTGQVLTRIEPDLLALNPDLVVVQVGVNDLKGVAMFPERAGWIIAECKRNIGAIVDKAKSGGARVLLTTVFPTGPIEPQRRPFWSSAIDSAIVEVNAYIRTLADARCDVVDAYALLESGGVVAEQFEQDALHINAAGYHALNAALAPRLADLAGGISRPSIVAR